MLAVTTEVTRLPYTSTWMVLFP